MVNYQTGYGEVPWMLRRGFQMQRSKKEGRKDFYVFMASSSKSTEPPLPIRALKCVVKQIFNALSEQVFLQSRAASFIHLYDLLITGNNMVFLSKWTAFEKEIPLALPH